MTSISFGSMFNPERTSNNVVFNPEYNIEGFAYGDADVPKDYPAFGNEDAGIPAFANEQIGRSLVKNPPKQDFLPHKLELSNEDKKLLSKLTSTTYGFHSDGKEFWFQTRKPNQGYATKLIMGDGKFKDETRNEFAKELVNDETQAFQIAGVDELGGNKLVTVVKNKEANTTTMYVCDSKQCFPSAINNDVDMDKIAKAAIDLLADVVGTTVWE